MTDAGPKPGALLHVLGLLVITWLSSAQARAAHEVEYYMAPDSAVEIIFHLAFSSTPQGGAVPMEIEIRNNRNERGEWFFTFNSGQPWQRQGLQFDASFKVEPKTTRRFPLVVPAFTSNQYSGTMQVNVIGPGCSAQSSQFPQPSRGSTSTPTPFLALSESLHNDLWGKLDAEIKTRSKEIYGTKADISLLPADWRALASVTALGLRDSEWDKLSAAQRESIKNWVATGGELMIFAEQGQNERKPLGLGIMGRVVPVVGKSLEAHAADRLEACSKDILEPILQPDPNASERPTWLSKVRINVILLSLVMLAFAILVGPYNFMVLAKEGRRHRLFFTTPALSVAATLILLLAIYLQDGVGGKGLRTVLVHILPEENQSVVQQEQIFRTGMIVKRNFRIAEPVLMLPTGNDHQSRNYEQSGQNFGGDWFTSRSLQSHLIQTIRPGRESITFFPGENGNPPEILSALPQPVDNLLVRKNGKSYAYDGTLQPGNRVKLTPAATTGIEYIDHRTNAFLKRSLGTIKRLPEYFLATSNNAQAVAIPTLGNIHWADDCVIFTGVPSNP